jgi:hypothetical protein
MPFTDGERIWRPGSHHGKPPRFPAPALFVLALAAALAAASPAVSQYIYLDTNSDGLNSWADSLNAGTTPVDIWLDTGNNRNGSAGGCATNGLASYSVILKALGGAVNWGTFTSAIPPSVGPFVVSNSTEWHIAVGFGTSGTGSPLGLYKLGTLNVGIASGTPCLDVGTSTTMNPRHSTSYGAGCPCKKFDHTNRLGPGWSDRDGLSATPSSPPALEAPGILVPKYLDPVAVDIHATPTTCIGVVSSLTADLSALPPGNNAVFTPGAGNQAGTLTWQPTATDHGDFPVIFRARGKNPNAVSARTMIIRLVTNVTAVDETDATERTFALLQSRPNPFNPVATIRYSVPRETHVRLAVYDLSGRAVALLVDRVESSGRHEARWSGDDDRGAPVASGVYWYRLTTVFGTATRRLVLAR